ncbi:PAS domain S-box-containing protein/diguanylate cyclase (GGDEF) domain-containing protein [Marinobacter daqiaonensis]|uniref:cyclic-guanylate-specific phosphodiesterase n=1 Tax=Marinobacter daqiaonensis TaxID=650891 RepID=A0A1I6HGU8_9GAMM|nr:EAL domain-containing protein [Marinobacter daqiaonensis]SFR53712.1 PAS domain S-box-containing protein/diguanylate cyclase (GGDEF) domain-containing protein [Marinobacter daqiaonensis]
MTRAPSGEQSSFTLSEFFRREAESIFEVWEVDARKAADCASRLPSRELRNNLPELLKTMADHADEALSGQSIAKLSVNAARNHAQLRWRRGYSLKEVAREYGILRSAIVQTLSDRISELSEKELRFLFESLDGAIVESVGTYVAISNQERESEQERLQVTLRNISDGVICTDADGLTHYLNPAAERITGWSGEDAIGKPVGEVVAVLDEASGQPVESMSELTLRTRDQSAHRSDILLERKDGRQVPVEEAAAPLWDSGGEFLGVVVTIRDVSNVRALTAQLGYLATRDPLTGLPNRALLKDRLMQEVAHAERHGERLALMYLDLDLFKEVNDMLGHTAGDDLLVEVAERLKNCVRRSDTVCRVGGDEFILLLTEFGEMASLNELGSKVSDTLREPFELEGHTVEISTSVGISVFPDDGHDPDSLIRHADTAMYQAKALGRNNMQFFAPAMNRRARERRELQRELRKALAEKQLSLHFQPQVELATGKVLAAEVLLRWRHPRLGSVSPNRFIPVAEERRELMISIGDWVLEESCRQARAWLDAGYPPVRVSVNVSMVQLRGDSLVDHVADVLDRFRLPPNQLQLELTESVLMSDVAGAADRIRSLEKMGVRISVDDFGTGYSSLSYLKDLPVDELKIDQTFVHDLASDPDKAAIVNAIIRMGQSLNLRVIAEGVETSGLVDYLCANGCEYAQGFYFGKPVTAKRFEGRFLS